MRGQHTSGGSTPTLSLSLGRRGFWRAARTTYSKWFQVTCRLGTAVTGTYGLVSPDVKLKWLEYETQSFMKWMCLMLSYLSALSHEWLKLTRQQRCLVTPQSRLSNASRHFSFKYSSYENLIERTFVFFIKFTFPFSFVRYAVSVQVSYFIHALPFLPAQWD